MLTKTGLTVTIYLRSFGHTAAPGRPANPAFGRCFRPRRPTGVPLPEVGVFAYYHPKGAPWANVSGSKRLTEWPWIIGIVHAYHYFPNLARRTLPPALWANIWIMRSRRVRF